MLRAARRAAGGLAALVALLLAALLLGALIPRNPGWRPAVEGVTIGIDASAVHAELILPVSAAGHDWRAVLPAGTVPPGTSHLAFSCGERAFFLATPSWADVDVGLALRALFASNESLVHLYRLDRFWGRPLTLSPAQYHRLVAHLQREIAPGAPIPGYGAGDLFLPGAGRYSALRTCNDWVADALAQAGVRVGVWTPLPQGFIWRFEEAREG
jgi:uncharacterized protein (TIGR02117 family)